MAFTEVFIPNSRHSHFYFYAATAGSADESLSESLDLSCAFELCEVRLHLSAVHASTESFVVTVDAYGGAAYDTIVDDWSAEGLQDHTWRPSIPMLCQKGDIITFALAKSAATIGKAGLTVCGWCVNDPS